MAIEASISRSARGVAMKASTSYANSFTSSTNVSALQVDIAALRCQVCESEAIDCGSVRWGWCLVDINDESDECMWMHGLYGTVVRQTHSFIHKQKARGKLSSMACKHI